MKTDGRVLLGTILGKKAEVFYIKQIEDFLYFVRSLALVNPNAEEEKVRERLQGIISTILQKTIKFFLIEKCGTAGDGTIKVSVTNDEIHDLNGKIVEEVVEFKKNIRNISEQILDMGLDEFEKGRPLAIEIMGRVKDSTNKNTRRKVERDYAITPPLEEIEIEMLRLEKKLPFLSHEEGHKLADLYNKWHQLESEKELYMEKT